MAELPENINVFDYLVQDATPKTAQLGAPDGRKLLEHSTPHAHGRRSQHANGDGSQYLQYGYSYGDAPIQPGMERYDSWPHLAEPQPPQQFVTPANKESRKLKKNEKGEKSDKKRKRNVEELDLSSSKRPQSRDQQMGDAPGTGRSLHSGLTGGLSRLVTDVDFYENDRIDAGPTPVSPLKRSKREKPVDDAAASKEKEKEKEKRKDDRRKSSYVSYGSAKPHPAPTDEKPRRSRSPERDRDRRDPPKPRRSQRADSVSSEDLSRATTTNHGRRAPKAIEYPGGRGTSVQPTATNAVVSYSRRAETFLSLVNKGPESQHGLSINKVLKRYHRERDVVRSEEKEEEDKELWKSLRLRRNSRGEIVVFV
jgi:cell growth-regulating nucleolar protein